MKAGIRKLIEYPLIFCGIVAVVYAILMLPKIFSNPPVFSLPAAPAAETIDWDAEIATVQEAVLSAPAPDPANLTWLAATGASVPVTIGSTTIAYENLGDGRCRYRFSGGSFFRTPGDFRSYDGLCTRASLGDIAGQFLREIKADLESWKSATQIRVSMSELYKVLSKVGAALPQE